MLYYLPTLTTLYPLIAFTDEKMRGCANEAVLKVNVYGSALIPRKLSCSKLFLVTHLYSDLSNHLLRRFHSWLLPFVDKMTTGTYNFVSLIVKDRLKGLILVLSEPATTKTQYFAHLAFNSVFQLINSIS